MKLLLDTQLPLWAAGQPDRPAIHLSGDSAIGFSGMEMETLVRYNFPVKNLSRRKPGSSY